MNEGREGVGGGEIRGKTGMGLGVKGDGRKGGIEGGEMETPKCPPVHLLLPRLRWEFIKENKKIRKREKRKKTRTRPRK